MDNNNKQKYLLAGESGGSKSVLSLISTDNFAIHHIVVNGVAALHNGLLPVEKELKEGIIELCEKTSIKSTSISNCYFSLGGPNVEEVKKALKNSIPDASVVVGREADGDLIMACAPYIGYNAAVMAGTGTVAVGEVDGKRYFAGGWGEIFDDAGSGYKIGKDAVIMALQALDGRIAKTSLIELIVDNKSNNIDSFADRMVFKQAINQLNRKSIAALAPKVYKHFLNGDKVAGQIIKTAAADLATLALGVIKNRESKARIIAIGGIFALGSEFRKLCSQKLTECCPYAEFDFSNTFSLSCGVCIMALKSAGIEITDAILSILIQYFASK